MMILERDGCEPQIEFGNRAAYPTFIKDPDLERELFAIRIDTFDTPVTESTQFTLDLPVDLVEELKQKVDVFSDEPMKRPMFEVDILPDRPGEVFVDGLFVCKEDKFKYGYNFPAHLIELGCDRSIANSLGLAWETSKVWAEKFNDPGEVLQMMTDGQLDVQDIHYHISKAQATRITKAFSERYGNVTIKSMGSSLGYGMSVGGSLYSTMKKSGKIKVANPYEEKGTPYRELVEFLEANKKHMRSKAVKHFNQLIEQSKGWKR
jgi:hypothetical protein